MLHIILDRISSNSTGHAIQQNNDKSYSNVEMVIWNAGISMWHVFQKAKIDKFYEMKEYGIGLHYTSFLTDDAWVSGMVRAPQKFLLSQKSRHLMGWRNMQKKICLPCLVPEILLFVYIFEQTQNCY